MARIKSFMLDSKGYCIVDNDKYYSVHSPGKVENFATLPQVKTILNNNIRSVEDARMVNSVFSFFHSRRNNHLPNGNARS